MFRQIIHPQTSNDLLIRLPEEYISKEIEVIAFEVDVPKEKQGGIDANQKIRETMAFLETLPRINMSNFKFDRDEANER